MYHFYQNTPLGSKLIYPPSKVKTLFLSLRNGDNY